MNNIKFIFVLIIGLEFTSCHTSRVMGGGYKHEIECMGTELDGSVTLKTWGVGKNRIDALEQARKEAINAILFVGLRNGQNGCDVKPILNDPNAREKNSQYFDIFFEDGGAYKGFISGKDESIGKKVKLIGSDGDVMFGFIVRVLRTELKNQMLKDEILNLNQVGK